MHAMLICITATAASIHYNRTKNILHGDGWRQACPVAVEFCPATLKLKMFHFIVVCIYDPSWFPDRPRPLGTRWVVRRTAASYCMMFRIDGVD